MKDQVLQTIRTACSEHFGIDAGEVVSVALFHDDLGLSIAEISRVFTEVAQSYKLHIPKEEIKELVAGFVTVGDMLEFIEDELML